MKKKIFTTLTFFAVAIALAVTAQAQLQLHNVCNSGGSSYQSGYIDGETRGVVTINGAARTDGNNTHKPIPFQKREARNMDNGSNITPPVKENGAVDRYRYLLQFAPSTQGRASDVDRVELYFACNLALPEGFFEDGQLSKWNEAKKEWKDENGWDSLAVDGWQGEWTVFNSEPLFKLTKTTPTFTTGTNLNTVPYWYVSVPSYFQLRDGYLHSKTGATIGANGSFRIVSRAYNNNNTPCPPTTQCTCGTTLTTEHASYKSPTCTAHGFWSYDCPVKGKYTVKGEDATGHEWSETAVWKSEENTQCADSGTSGAGWYFECQNDCCKAYKSTGSVDKDNSEYATEVQFVFTNDLELEGATVQSCCDQDPIEFKDGKTATLYLPKGEYPFTVTHGESTLNETVTVGAKADGPEQVVIAAYTVTFKDYDDTTLVNVYVLDGGKAKAPAAPTREGYTFTGWDGEFDNVTNDLTVTATYTINKHTVMFVIKDEDETEKTKTVDVTDSETVQEPKQPKKNGSTFLGWFEDGDDEKAFDFNTPITGNKTLTAVFKTNEYMVTFVDYDNTELKTETVKHGDSATAPAVPTREGYDFDDWDRGFDSITGDLTVKALYTALPQTVTFKCEDGGMSNASKNNTVVIEAACNTGEAYLLPDNGNTNFVKDGYRWSGWVDGDGKTYAHNDTITMPAGGLTLYVEWHVVGQVIVFDPNGGEGEMTGANEGAKALHPEEFEEGQWFIIRETKFTFNLPANTFTRDGYDFTGWKTQEEAEYADKASFTVPVGGATFYAQWNALPAPIVYKSNGGQGPSDNTEYTDESYVTGNDYEILINALSSSLKFTRTGYTMTGWNTQADGKGVTYAPGDHSDMPAGGITLYAQWTPSSIWVTFNPNGGMGTIANSSVLTVLAGSTEDKFSEGEYFFIRGAGSEVTLPANGFTRDGYDFVGWNTCADGTGDSYEDQALFTVPFVEQRVILYAQWEQIPADFTGATPKKDNDGWYLPCNNSDRKARMESAVPSATLKWTADAVYGKLINIQTGWDIRCHLTITVSMTFDHDESATYNIVDVFELGNLSLTLTNAHTFPSRVAELFNDANPKGKSFNVVGETGVAEGVTVRVSSFPVVVAIVAGESSVSVPSRCISIEL